MYNPDCEQCGGNTQLLGTLGMLNHFRCRDCGWDMSEACEDDDDEISDDPFGGDDSRADAELLGERDGYNDEVEFDDDPCNFIGEEP